MNAPNPAVGEWYRRPNGSLFEVVAVDADDETIEVQHFDGTLEEVDFDAWEEQLVEEAQAPEDWTGSVDVEPEDVDNEISESAASFSSSPKLWSDALGYLDRSEARGYTEWPASTDDRY